MSKVITFVKKTSPMNHTLQENKEIFDGMKLLDMIAAVGELTDDIDEKWLKAMTSNFDSLDVEKMEAEVNKIKADGYEKLCDALYNMVTFLNAKLEED